MTAPDVSTVDKAALLERIKTIPCYDTLGVRDITFEAGKCRAIVPKNDAMNGIFHSYHGGMLMTAADTIACFAVLTLTGADACMATTDMNIRFLRACLTDVTVEAEVVRFGRQLCPVAVNLYDNHRALVAIAQVAFMRMEEPPRHKPV